MDEEALYRELRPAVFGVVYRMVGSVTEAEDLVQEAFLRFHRAVASGERIESSKAYLATVVSRLAVRVTLIAAANWCPGRARLLYGSGGLS